MNQALENPLTQRLLDSGDISTSIATSMIGMASNAEVVRGLLGIDDISDTQLCDAIADVFSLKQLKTQDIPAVVNAEFLPLADFLFQQQALPLGGNNGVLSVAMCNPFDEITIKVLETKLGTRKQPIQVQPVVATRTQILASLLALYKPPNETALMPEPSSVTDEQESSPLVAQINAVMHGAVIEGASDIHIEPDKSGLRVRYRVDGLLYNKHQFAQEVNEQVISRFKLMAKMDVTERRFAQDGRFSFQSQGRSIDIRVSSIPLAYSESIVLRLLDQELGAQPLTELGLEQNLANRLAALSLRQSGILLITGPTGSGKTTTLYSLMQGLNDSTRKLVSIEDPVEMKMPGVNQVQIDEVYGISFADSLRAVLRQDPDVILVGEIRDEQTAKLVVQAALTGHLVLSTLHTSSAIGSIQRLRNLGVSDSMIKATVLGVVAQRLVRLSCVECCENIDSLNIENAKGCDACSNTGYRNRAAVAELMELEPSQELPIDADHRLQKDALFEGRDLIDAARELLKNQRTTSTELARVLGVDLMNAKFTEESLNNSRS